MSTFYFAWVGGDPLPPLSLATIGDLWSGSFQTVGIVWGGTKATTGDIVDPFTVTDMADVIGLVSGGVYTVTGTGIPSVFNGDLADTTLTYNGAGGGVLSQAAASAAPDVSLTLARASGTSTVILEEAGPLISGVTYSISGSGIPVNTEFTFTGDPTITLSNPATSTGEVALTIGSPLGRNVIGNIASTSGMVAGLTYEVFGKGLPAGAQGIYQGGNSLTLLVDATESAAGVALTISKGRTYPDGGPFDQSVHLREDEDIFALEISQTEGGFPAATIDVKNPRIGLLAAGRNLWAWLSWRNDSDEIVPLFHGRLVGVPEKLTDEIVRLLFIARPNDYVNQKSILAAGLRALPYWDPVWLIDSVGNPDTVLETRAALWHVDRLTLEVTASDYLEGEDGTIDISADEHFYDGVDVKYGAPPLRRVNVTGTVNWTQSAEGSVDLTARLVAAFQEAGSPYPWPLVSSYTANGLLSTWPKANASLGGGWSMAGNAAGDPISSTSAEWTPSATYAVRYTDKSDNTSILAPTELDSLGNALPTSMPKLFFTGWKNFDVVFQLDPIVTNFVVTYAADRRRSEYVSFVVSADVQAVVTDADTAEDETIALSSAFVDQPIDEFGALPIGDVRRNAYFATDRGQQSLQFLMLLGRARLRLRARAVDVICAPTWEKIAGTISCRKSLLVHDGRFPAGQAKGKVKSWRLLSGDGKMEAEATIGCSVGYGVPLVLAPGADGYADDYSGGYDEATGAQIGVIDGELHYQSLDGTFVIDDDGVDLFNLTPQTAVKALSVTNGPMQQRAAIDGSMLAQSATVRLATKGDIIADPSIPPASPSPIPPFPSPALGKTVANLRSTVGLVAGRVYSVTAPSTDRPGLLQSFTTGGAKTTFTFAGGTGGTLSEAAAAGEGVDLVIFNPDGAVVLPDPVAALGATPTRVELDLVPVTGGDFLTTYLVDVLPLVIPQTVNLEAAA